jgi:hypothetical protein
MRERRETPRIPPFSHYLEQGILYWYRASCNSNRLNAEIRFFEDPVSSIGAILGVDPLVCTYSGPVSNFRGIRC